MKIIAPISSSDTAKYIASLDCTGKGKKCIKVLKTVCRRKCVISDLKLLATMANFLHFINGMA